MTAGIPKARVKKAIDSADSRGKAALWCAASKGQAPMARLLIKRGASVNAADNKRGSSAPIVASLAEQTHNNHLNQTHSHLPRQSSIAWHACATSWRWRAPTRRLARPALPSARGPGPP